MMLADKLKSWGKFLLPGQEHCVLILMQFFLSDMWYIEIFSIGFTHFIFLMQQKTDGICKMKHLYSLPSFPSHPIILEAHICDAVSLIYRNQVQKPGFQGKERF